MNDLRDDLAGASWQRDPSFDFGAVAFAVVMVVLWVLLPIIPTLLEIGG